MNLLITEHPRALYGVNNNETETKKLGTMNVDGTEFEYEIYLLPILSTNPDKYVIEKDLIQRLGTRTKNGKLCLDIGVDIVEKNLKNDEYSAMAFIKNKKCNDSASGTLQYMDWCSNTEKIRTNGEKQIWVNDLCRITRDKKSRVSPVKALFRLLEQTIIELLGKKADYLYLMVDNKQPIQDLSKEAEVLINIYKKYGFSIVDAANCNFGSNNIVVMKKSIDVTKSSNLTKKRGLFGAKGRRIRRTRKR